TLLLLICFTLVNPIWHFSTFRMWTAAHIFIYGLLPFVFEGKKRGGAIASLSVLVHFSFIVPVGLLLSYTLLGNRLTLYFIFFLSTLFISEINIETFNDVIEHYTPEVFQERTSGYRSASQVEDYRDGPEKNLNWYVI